MKISILCSDNEHPVYEFLVRWAADRQYKHRVELKTRASELTGGDLLFLISCVEIVGSELRRAYDNTLVVHASALPKGRGWSPHIWQILDGQNTIPVTLLEAEDRVDTGTIWKQKNLELEGHELYDEINVKLFDVISQLMVFAVENAETVRPQSQIGIADYYRRRTKEDSKLDPNKTIAEQFDLLRVADASRFPCFIEYRGKRYTVSLKKEDVP